MKIQFKLQRLCKVLTAQMNMLIEIININDEQNIKKKINFQLYIYIQNYHNFHLWYSAHN